MEGKPVLLSCEVSSANVPVTWRKDNTVMEAGGRYILKKKGSIHTLEIDNIQPEDAGEYCCVTRGKKTTAKLVVRGRSNFNFTNLFHSYQQIIRLFCFLHRARSDC